MLFPTAALEVVLPRPRGFTSGNALQCVTLRVTALETG